MKNQVLEAAENYVVGLLGNGLTKDHQYHDLPHTLSVREAAQALGQRYQLPAEDLEMLELAALFHDTGFVQTYDSHEDVSKKIAADFLQKEGYDAGKTSQVQTLIEMTRVGVTPETLLEKIIKDADFNTLNTSYEEKSDALRHEWEVFKDMKMADEKWLENNLNFWDEHQFFTGEATAMFGDDRRKMLKMLKKKMEKATEKTEKNKDKNKKEDGGDFAINNSKSAQMMLKTTLRNQIDLTNIADNKANIMLTINSALITFGIPLLAARLAEHPELIFPASTLLLTCILSIVSATLATRPVKMKGITDLEQIDKGNTNLFFFGNFFKMPIGEYQQGLKKVVKSDELLDKAIYNDLYFLGISLGRKYTHLHTTYTIFMYGMVTTVIVYALATMLSGHH